jgi:hypothetical protein
VNFYSTFSPKHNFYSPRLMRTPTLRPTPHCCVHLTMCQQALMDDIPSIEGTCGNSLMIKMNMFEENQHIPIKEINSDDLVLIKKIGEGSFGSIHLAEMQVEKKQHVIVKSINDHANDKQK